jgi:hypothetical protein
VGAIWDVRETKEIEEDFEKDETGAHRRSSKSSTVWN